MLKMAIFQSLAVCEVSAMPMLSRALRLGNLQYLIHARRLPGLS